MHERPYELISTPSGAPLPLTAGATCERSGKRQVVGLDSAGCRRRLDGVATWSTAAEGAASVAIEQARGQVGGRGGGDGAGGPVGREHWANLARSGSRSLVQTMLGNAGLRPAEVRRGVSLVDATVGFRSPLMPAHLGRATR